MSLFLGITASVLGVIALAKLLNINRLLRVILLTSLSALYWEGWSY